MPSFLDHRTASFYSWPQGPTTIHGEPNEPFMLAQGHAYYFDEVPATVRLPEGSPYPGMTVSFVSKIGGPVEIQNSRGDPIPASPMTLTPDGLITFTYINQQEQWKQIKV